MLILHLAQTHNEKYYDWIPGYYLSLRIIILQFLWITLLLSHIAIKITDLIWEYIYVV